MKPIPNEPTILVVDDHPAIRRALRSMLEPITVKIEEAGSGNEALQKAEVTTFDLVITDIVMPDCDGIELIQKLKPLYPTTRVLAISGSVNLTNYLRTAVFLGADAALPKPVATSELLAVVRDLLASRAVAA